MEITELPAICRRLISAGFKYESGPDDRGEVTFWCNAPGHERAPTLAVNVHRGVYYCSLCRHGSHVNMLLWRDAPGFPGGADSP